MNVIEDHVEQGVGKISRVYHEIISDELHLRKGAQALLEGLLRNGQNEVVDINRKNIYKKRFGIF